MSSTFYLYFIVAIVPMIVGYIYSTPKVLGTVWMKTNNFTDEYLKEANMAVVFGVSYLFSLIATFLLSRFVIHQSALFSLFVPEIMTSGSEAQATFNTIMETYGDAHRSFKQGLCHGIFISIMFLFPITGINALFERRGWKYIFIHTGYWFISLSIMGGLLCQFLVFASPA